MNNAPCQNEYDLRNYENELAIEPIPDEYYRKQLKTILEYFYMPEKRSWIEDSLESLFFDAALDGSDYYFEFDDFKTIIETAFECDRIDIVLFIFNLHRNKNFNALYKYSMSAIPSIESFNRHEAFLSNATNEEFLYWFSNEMFNFMNRKEN